MIGSSWRRIDGGVTSCLPEAGRNSGLIGWRVCRIAGGGPGSDGGDQGSRVDRYASWLWVMSVTMIGLWTSGGQPNVSIPGRGIEVDIGEVWELEDVALE